MPTYSYKCSSCHDHLTVRHAMAGPAPQDCDCGGALSRIYDAPAIQMKGLDFARNHHQDLLAKAQRDPTLRKRADSESAHHHGPGGHHGMTPAVVERMHGSTGAKK